MTLQKVKDIATGTNASSVSQEKGKIENFVYEKILVPFSCFEREKLWVSAVLN